MNNKATIVQDKLLDISVMLWEGINDHLKNDGDTCENSQRVCLLERLGKVQHSIQGIEDEDLLPNVIGDDELLVEPVIGYNLERDIIINGVKIIDTCCEKENYNLVERTDKIDDITGFISESTGNDTQMMLDDIVYLAGLPDEWILSSMDVNEYLSLSENRGEFIRICNLLTD